MNFFASRTLSRISIRCRRGSDLECIECVGLGGSFHQRLEKIAPYHVHRSLEQRGDERLERHVVIDIPYRVGFHLDQDIDIAVRAGVTSCAGAKQGRMRNSPRTQGGFVLLQPGDNGVLVHERQYSAFSRRRLSHTGASRAASVRMIACRSASLIEPQRAISSSVRPQPRQMPRAESISQTLMQGEEIMAKLAATSELDCLVL